MYRSISCVWVTRGLLWLALFGPGIAHGQDAGDTPRDGDGAAQGPVTDSAASDSAVDGDVQDSAADGAETRPWFQGVSRERRARARDLFREGNRLLRDGLFAPASEHYKQAIALWEHPAFYYNLAITQLSLVQPIEAHNSILEALRYGAVGLGEEKYPRAADYKKRLEEQLAKVAIRCDEEGVQVTLDGQPVKLVHGRYEQVLLPGSHQVYAKKEGRVPDDRQIVMSSGERVQVELVLGYPDRVETVRYMPNWIPWTALGVSAAVLGGAGYLDRHSSQELTSFDRDFNSRCRRGCQDSEVQDLTDRLDSAESHKRMALGLYIAGGVMVMGSAALVYVNRERIKRTTVERKAFSVVPIITLDAAGFTAALTF